MSGGVLTFNVGKLVKPPKVKNTLAERILTEHQVLHLIASEPGLRNQVLLRFLYATGARVSEVCALRWRDLQATRKGRGQVTFLGKGNKTRAVIFSSTTWTAIQSLQTAAGFNDPVFQSRQGGHLDRSQVQRILAAAAKRVGIPAHVSPHWLRHAHASHSLERGTPISVVQSTLGHASVATTGIYLHVRPHDSSALHLAV